MNENKSKSSKSKLYAKLAIIFISLALGISILFSGVSLMTREVPVHNGYNTTYVKTYMAVASVYVGIVGFFVSSFPILYIVFAVLAAFLTTNTTAKLLTFIAWDFPPFAIIGLAFIMKENRDVIIPTPEKSEPGNTSILNKE